VKNQYFADRRDLFKYDLLLDLVERRGSQRRLTFIPMLTAGDESGEGNVTRYGRDGRRPVVYEYLRDALSSGRRDIRLLRQLMSQVDVEFMAYRDDRWFEDKTRREYFARIPIEGLESSVVFFDPDIGLQTGSPGYMRRKGAEKYLMYSELTDVWKRASHDSVVVVYQHLQKDATKRAHDVDRRLAELNRHLEAQRSWAVQSGDLAFLVLARDPDVALRIRLALDEHVRRHRLVFREVTEGQ